MLPGALLVLAVAGCTGTPDDGPRPSASPTATGAPATVVARVCAKPEPGPAQAPPGAVTVDPAVVGDLAAKTESSPAHTTFWLRPGTHRLVPKQYAQVLPKKGNTYLGAPGAVLDGRRVNQYAFGGPAPDVTIRNLTVQGFIPPQDEGVVNNSSADGWVIEHNTIQKNAGGGMMVGARQQIRANCLRDNGQYGVNSYKDGDSIRGLVVEGNEVTGNNTDDWERKRPGCGCTAGIKFWAVNGADVRGNWVHDNRGAGLWADNNNNDFLFENNVIEANDGAGLMYETSYNTIIRNNTFRRNNVVEGRRLADRGDTFPYATIYVSEAGGEPRIKARTSRIEIYRNLLENNWNGITLWENSNRFCNSPANTSTGYCTLLVKDTKSCAQPAIAKKPLYDDCRWKTQRVFVHDNRFVVDSAALGCTEECARSAVLSNYGTWPAWSPYKAKKVSDALIHKQDNRWRDNDYLGPWNFVADDPAVRIDAAQWQEAPYRQDVGSVFEQQAGG
ncbi:right-handed parallel beta-helix repeat-containing protein [Streptomyces sp. NPDC087440]|uniref:right-handed parallel beta-helix repeat-containing protein n=1 Tax=Streptomyces sp. NPDC087440 TaxID=3365790 RepID=UPI003806B26A